MLTKRSSRLKSVKLIVVVPLLLCCMVCFTQNAFSNTKKITGNKIFYNGNVFESSWADTTIVFNGDSNAANEQMKHFPEIIKMNEKPVYSYYPVFTYRADKDVDPAHAVVRKSTYQFYQYLLDSTMSLLTQLDDGFYNLGIYTPVIDENGKLVYYEDEPFQSAVDDTLMHQAGMRSFGKDDEYGILMGAPRFWWKKDHSKWKYLKIDSRLKDAIDKKMYALLENMPAMERVYKNGKAVPYRLERGTKYGGFDIKNHHFAIIPVSSANY